MSGASSQRWRLPGLWSAGRAMRRAAACWPWCVPGARRLAACALARRHTEARDPTLAQFGNWWLDPLRLNEKSIVYSCGVGTHIEFDLAVTHLIGCPVHMFDPTPKSWELMNTRAGHRLLRYEPIGVWSEDGTARFWHDRAYPQASAVANASITNLFGREEAFDAPVLTIASLLAAHGHDRLDVLKLDVEGAAPAVLLQMLASGVFPDQIAAEIELPRCARAMTGFCGEVRELCEELRARGYRLVRLPHGRGGPTLRILALRGDPA